jgi:hypothetical protein
MKQRDKYAADQLRRQIRQLILLRETGPKSAAWHAARSRLIWRLQDEVRQVDQERPTVPQAAVDEGEMRDGTA